MKFMSPEEHKREDAKQQHTQLQTNQTQASSSPSTRVSRVKMAHKLMGDLSTSTHTTRNVSKMNNRNNTKEIKRKQQLRQACQAPDLIPDDIFFMNFDCTNLSMSTPNSPVKQHRNSPNSNNNHEEPWGWLFKSKVS